MTSAFYIACNAAVSLPIRDFVYVIPLVKGEGDTRKVVSPAGDQCRPDGGGEKERGGREMRRERERERESVRERHTHIE